MNPRSKIAFTTLGCRVNQYDTQVLREQAERAAFEAVPFEADADIYVINTCTVTAAADAEGKQLVRRVKARNPGSFVVVTGCLAQDRPEEISGLPGVDLVVGNVGKPELLRKILSVYPGKDPNADPAVVEGHSVPTPCPVLVDTDVTMKTGQERTSHIPAVKWKSVWGAGISRFEGHRRATIKVQEGCGFGCSFCLIPRVRGEMISRPAAEVLEEGKRLAANGVKELVLAGIQLSSYARDLGVPAGEPRLAPVIEKLLALPGIHRVRLSSYAVADFEDALLPLWKDGRGLCPHLHLPLQSGDPGVLRAMRRPYSLERYRETVAKVRSAAPGIGLTSDILAGFPGETEEAFQNTLDRILEFGFLDFHPFPYSDRPGTPGETMGPKTASGVLRDRMKRLRTLKAECLERSALGAEGRTFPLVIERSGESGFAGLSPEGLRVHFAGKPGELGQEVMVEVGPPRGGKAWVHLV